MGVWVGNTLIEAGEIRYGVSEGETGKGENI